MTFMNGHRQREGRKESGVDPALARRGEKAGSGSRVQTTDMC